MKVDFDFVVSRGFQLKKKDDFVLITPSFDKHVWLEDELHYRSLMCRSNGEIVSSGLEKFMNYFEYAPHTKIVNDAILSGTEAVYFTDKEDGSLIIRDIIDGQVHFRSRGSTELTGTEDDCFDGSAVLRLIAEEYPELLDNTVGIGASLLFEYTAPTNQIILKYNKPTLTYLGMMVHHEDLFPILVPFFDNAPVPIPWPIPKMYSIPIETTQDLLEEISSWKDREGLVVYVKHDDRWILSKMKTKWYLQLHSFKYQMTKSKFFQLLWKENICNTDQYEMMMMMKGFDFELIEYGRSMVEEYFQKREEVAGICIHLQNELLDAFEDTNTIISRKEQIDILRTLPGNFNDYIAILDGKIHDFLGSKLLDMSFTQLHTFEKE